MRRFIPVIFLASLIVIIAGPASAASNVTSTFHFHGTVAEGDWFTSSSTSFTDTYMNVSKTSRGAELFVDQFTGNVDKKGNFTGGSEVFGDVTSGFTSSIDSMLTTASVSDSAMPVTVCAIDANFNETCGSTTTVGLSANWTGQGSLSRGTFTDHFSSDGFKETDHFQGTFRDATATGSFGSLTLTASELEFADIAKVTSGSVFLCFGTCF